MKKILTLALVAVLAFCAATVMAQDDKNETCLGCHADPGMKGTDAKGAEFSLTVLAATLDSSVHKGNNCVDCHADLAGTRDYPHKETVAKVNCGTCHSDVEEIYKNSAHGTAAPGNPNAPSCASCHGKHNILPLSDSHSMVSPTNLPHTCSNCHSRFAIKNDPDIRVADSYDRYMRGIHAKGLAKGIGSAASCNDCHGMHDLRKASDPKSLVNKMNIPTTCSKCHNDIYIQYSKGIHGKALAAGILDAPNCTDCHGEHEILEISDPKSPVNGSNIADFVCSKCHNNARIAEKYGLAKGQFSSYQDSYHGLAVKGGSVKAANCASCHMAHTILPASNPASSINKDNLTATCQKCHPNATLAFATSYTHATAQAEFFKLDTTVRIVYIIAIVLIVGGMLIHNLIIFFRFVVEKHRQNQAQPTVERFSKSMVYQHLVVTIAFMILVVTGFALRYPNEWWVKVLNFVGIFEDVRGVIHRMAALLLMYISIHHAIFLLLTRRGKEEFKAMLPAKDDLGNVKKNIFYFLGRSKNAPRFDRYDYTEKAEYWALVWGTFIMALTGCVLWFPAFFTSFLPAWTVRIAETVHLYEAWLATLAIAVFHFFFVIFHPDQYPMSMTWITGRMTVEACKHHHPLWYERMSQGAEGDSSSPTGAQEQPAEKR